jgi:D-alanyl-D-alanine carboxypeptidase (penicillin-binding protein 5/6)
MKITLSNVRFKMAIAGALAVAASCATAAPIVVPDAPQVSAKGFVLMDYHSGAILAEKNKDEQLSPASLTKMMTSYVIGQELKRGNISSDDKVVISKNAWAKKLS